MIPGDLAAVVIRRKYNYERVTGVFLKEELHLVYRTREPKQESPW